MHSLPGNQRVGEIQTLLFHALGKSVTLACTLWRGEKSPSCAGNETTTALVYSP
jgi:hypothetical protein